eukprot:GILJ01004333.1.p1 GENE.GILJ01004333.1~~GILJ01004333.1.p1  ORF type:complete len:628 (-),score=93.75 GILJ01004333.1:111-1793(-)
MDLKDFGTDRLNMFAALAAIDSAAKDDRIRGLCATSTSLSMLSSADYEELRAAVNKFKMMSNKPTVFYSESLDSLAMYHFATAFDKIAVQPLGDIATGMSRNFFFIGEFLKRWGVRFEKTQSGKHKSFLDTFTRNDMSSENREQQERILSSVYQELLTSISSAREISVKALQKVFALGPFNSVQASSLDLIDDACHAPDAYRRGFQDIFASGAKGLRTVSFTNYITPLLLTPSAERVAQIVKDKDGNELLESTSSVFPSNLTSPEVPTVRRVELVPVVTCHGEITSGKSLSKRTIGAETLCRILAKLESKPQVETIILRLDTPGGSGIASETIWRQIKELRSKGKKVIVSMGSVTASGGYYIASAANEIVASKTTITGSIGVFAMIPNIDRLLEKYGVSVDAVSRGGNLEKALKVDMMKVRRRVEIMNQLFQHRVAEGRGLPRKLVDGLAGGRIWSGDDARALGLVDHLGGLEVAMMRAFKISEFKPDIIVFKEIPCVESPFFSGFEPYADTLGLSKIFQAWESLSYLFELRNKLETISTAPQVEMRADLSGLESIVGHP